MNNQTPPHIQAALEQHYGAFYRAFRQKSSAEVQGVIISGSGLNAVLEHYQASEIIHANDIPGFPSPTVVGHSSSIRLLTIEGKRVAHFTGRCHLYEGWTLQESLAQIGLARLLGAEFAVITNSAGGMFHTFTPGDIMLIEDSLNLMFRPVQGEWLSAGLLQNNDYSRRASGETIHSTAWRKRITPELTARSVPFHQGTYIALTGPTFETPSEARMYRKLGGQAIGMSTAHEAEFASLCGMRVAACSLITNMLPESAMVNVSHQSVLTSAGIGAPRIAEFISAACKTA
jgi:inosine/guanosine/xanthosine phosphorylase family protein